MNTGFRGMSFGERIGAQLCEYYRKYGYSQYRMSKFEEYDLYARNKDFLDSDAVLTFTDLGGKLMALKPDVTLSIVRNTRDSGSDVQKVYYTENVYRAKGSSFQEILQTGLECIGTLDNYLISEVLILAAGSLQMISSDCVLAISHLDILSELLDRLNVIGEVRGKMLQCIAAKNLHELKALCLASGADSAASETLQKFILLSGSLSDVLPQLQALVPESKALEQLRCISRNFDAAGLSGMLRLDFSIVDDMAYYSGIIFKGYVSGVAVSVISGGRYDRLMAKMGRSSAAIGFAVYLDALERLEDDTPEFDIDLALLYDDETDTAALSAAMQRLTQEGLAVRALKRIPDKLKSRQIGRMNGNEVEIL